MASLNPAGSITFPSVPFPGYVTGRFYPAVLTESLYPSNSTIVADRQHYQPFYCRSARSFSAITVRQHNAAPTGNIRLGIYSSSSGGIGSLLQDIGAVAFPGSTGLRTITTTITLAANTLYWVSFVADAALSITMAMLPSGQSDRRLTHDIGAVDATYVTGQGPGAFYGAFTYAALPSTPTTPTGQTNEFLYALLTG